MSSVNDLSPKAPSFAGSVQSDVLSNSCSDSKCVQALLVCTTHAGQTLSADLNKISVSINFRNSKRRTLHDASIARHVMCPVACDRVEFPSEFGRHK